MSVAPSDSISNVASGPPPSTALTVPTTTGGSSSKKRGKKKNSSGTSRASSSVPGVPRPQHLSTTSTPTRDDPMLIDEFTVSGADSMAPVTIRPTVGLDHSGYFVLVDQVYSQIVLTDSRFSTVVPQPLFLWYCTLALWYRYIYLSVSYGRSEVDNVVLLGRYASMVWNLPEPILRYLNGIGEFRSPTGDLFRPAPPSWPTTTSIDPNGRSGSFGRVDSSTWIKYVAFPSPFVVSWNIVCAMARSSNVGNWSGDLPAALQPAAAPEGFAWRITRNFGFDPDLTLTAKQIQTLRNLGYSATATLGTWNSSDRFAFYGPSVSHVSEALGSLQKYKVSVFTNNSTTGSLSVGPFLVPSSENAPYGARWIDGEFEVNSSFSVESRISSASLLMAYRVKREATEDGILPGMPYEYIAVADESDHPPPQGYLGRANSLFTLGQSPRLNHSWFETQLVERGSAVSEMARAFAKH